MPQPKLTVIDRIEAYIQRYLALADPMYSLPIALWIAATYTWEAFDAFPYVCITSLTKQSGKSTLASLMEFASCRPQSLTGITPAAMFHCIEQNKPVLFYDEAETLNSEAASMMRQVLNVGYQRGRSIQRLGDKGLREYETYCPKVFVLIGDLNDTLRDRSIIVRMKRGKAPERYNRMKCIGEGKDLREELAETLQVEDKDKAGVMHVIEDVKDGYKSFSGLPFLMPRDEEIWTPLFVLCELLCPKRIGELTKAAVDMSTEKTQEIVSYRASATAEEHVESEMYALMLLRNVLEVAPKITIRREAKVQKGKPQTSSGTYLNPDEVLTALKLLIAAPWRKYKHDGLTRDQMADLLSRHFGLKTQAYRVGGIKDKPVRVYDLAAIQAKANEVGITQKGDE